MRIRKAHISRKGAKFVAGWEGFLRCPKRDTLAVPPVWTIGYGNTIGVTANTPCTTEAKARRELKKRLTRRFVSAIPKSGKMRQQEIDALGSFAYNVGPGAVNDPGFSTLARRLLSPEGDTFAGRCRIYGDELHKWNRAGGVALAGLTARRAAECKLAMRGVYDSTH